MSSLYLLVNVFTVSIPFLFSFHPKIDFFRYWKYFFPAAISVGIVFVIWDIVFTARGVWGFNSSYLLGIYFFGLPIEEMLFFICIPFSCVFTYFCLDKFFDLSWNSKAEAVSCMGLSLVLFILGLFFWDRLYTAVTFISTSMVCLFLKFVVKINWWGKVVSIYGILLVPFLAVNGILTGTGLEEPVVWYNPDENMHIRLLTIPLEDAVYGFELIVLNIYFFKLLESKFTSWAKKNSERDVLPK